MITINRRVSRSVLKRTTGLYDVSEREQCLVSQHHVIVFLRELRRRRNSTIKQSVTAANCRWTVFMLAYSSENIPEGYTQNTLRFNNPLFAFSAIGFSLYRCKQCSSDFFFKTKKRKGRRKKKEKEAEKEEEKEEED